MPDTLTGDVRQRRSMQKKAGSRKPAGPRKQRCRRSILFGKNGEHALRCGSVCRVLCAEVWLALIVAVDFPETTMVIDFDAAEIVFALGSLSAVKCAKVRTASTNFACTSGSSSSIPSVFIRRPPVKVPRSAWLSASILALFDIPSSYSHATPKRFRMARREREELRSVWHSGRQRF